MEGVTLVDEWLQGKEGLLAEGVMGGGDEGGGGN